MLRVERDDPAGVKVDAGDGIEVFDEIVFACHPDQTLALLGAGATAEERAVLGAVKYQNNEAWLHTDSALLPRRRSVWSAWNYLAGRGAPGEMPVSVSYLLNRLQPLPFTTPVVVSLNPVTEPRADTVVGEYEYDHPIFDLGAIAAQQRVPQLQGVSHTWFCGAWTRYGFHEDGLMSGEAVVEGLRAAWAAQRPDAEAA